MALYSMKDAVDSKYSKPDFRTLQVVEGLKNAKKIWIPEFSFAYKRTHFNVQKRTKFTQAKFNTLDCFNQKLGDKGKGCPICEIVDELWTKWRETKDKEAKQALTAQINSIMNEEYWFNAIDLSDPNRAFVAFRVTPSKFTAIRQAAKDMEAIGKDISDLIFTFSMTKEGKIVKYQLMYDADQEEKISKLHETFETLNARSYEDGGPIDLEKCIIARTRTIDEYNDILFNSEAEPGDQPAEEEHAPKSDKKAPPKSTPKTKEKEPVVEEESLSLEDVGLSMDDIGPGLEEPAKDEPKIVTIEVDAKKIIAEKNSKEYIVPLYDHLLLSKHVKPCADYAAKVKAVFEYVKAEKAIQVPEAVWKKPEPKKPVDDDLELSLD